MTAEELKLANKINSEIKEIESFLFYAEKVWTGKIIKRTSKFILKSNPYGYFNEAEYHLDTETKDKVLDVIREKLTELRAQLSEI